MTKVDEIEIHLQEFIFGVELGQFLGQENFTDLAFHRLAEALFGRKKELARQLHGDGAGTRNNAAPLRIL